MNNVSHIYGLTLAGVTVNICLHFKQNYYYFKKYLHPPVAGLNALEIGQYEKAVIVQGYPENLHGCLAERRILTVLVSDALLSYHRLIFHSVAVQINKQIWLLAAPSGTGKTTQYLNLKTLYPQKIIVLCGDNPVLQFKDNNTILVHPSPWKGKEGYGNEFSGRLTGIVMLEQGQDNHLCFIPTQKSVVPIFRQFNTFLKTEEQVHQLLNLERKLLEMVPVLHFKNTGSLESSRILYDYLTNYYDE